MSVLSVESIGKRYGAIVVADDLCLDVAHGECLGIIGPNGAGKTSLFNIIDGSIQPDRGRVLLNGRDITRMPCHERVRCGLARAYQVPQAFGELTVFENVLASASFGARLATHAAMDLAAETLERTGLIAKADRLSGSLPLLDRKRLELARALGAQPRLLLLDEIAGGLTEFEVRDLVNLILSLKNDVAMIWIEHVAHALMAVADRVLALNFGACIAQGSPTQVMADSRVQEIYMGVVLDAPAIH